MGSFPRALKWPSNLSLRQRKLAEVKAVKANITLDLDSQVVYNIKNEEISETPLE